MYVLYTECVELAAMIVLPSLLPDARVKVDVTKVIQVANVRVHVTWLLLVN